MLRLFDRKSPEEVSERYRYQSLFEEILEKCESIQQELEQDRISSSQIAIDSIASKIEEATEEVLSAIDGLALGETKVADTPDVSERLVALLSQAESMSFTELLEASGVAKTTLSRHLSKLLEDGKIERIETDRKVLYRLVSRNADTNQNANGD